MLLVIVFMMEEIIRRELFIVLSVVDAGILGGIVIITYSLALVLIREPRVQLTEVEVLLAMVEVYVDV